MKHKITAVIINDRVIPADLLLDSDQAAIIKGVSRQTIESLVKRGLLDAFELPSRTMISKKELLAYRPKSGRPRKAKQQASAA